MLMVWPMFDWIRYNRTQGQLYRPPICPPFHTFSKYSPETSQFWFLKRKSALATNLPEQAFFSSDYSFWIPLKCLDKSNASLHARQVHQNSWLTCDKTGFSKYPIIQRWQKDSVFCKWLVALFHIKGPAQAFWKYKCYQFVRYIKFTGNLRQLLYE